LLIGAAFSTSDSLHPNSWSNAVAGEISVESSLGEELGLAGFWECKNVSCTKIPFAFVALAMDCHGLVHSNGGNCPQSRLCGSIAPLRCLTEIFTSDGRLDQLLDARESARRNGSPYQQFRAALKQDLKFTTTRKVAGVSKSLELDRLSLGPSYDNRFVYWSYTAGTLWTMPRAGQTGPAHPIGQR